MNRHRTTLAAVLHELRPEASLDALPPDADLREELDLDSMDILNLVIALSDATGVDIPEKDYGRLSTLEGCVAYLEARDA